MNVKELIDALKQYDPNTQIRIAIKPNINGTGRILYMEKITSTLIYIWVDRSK